MRALRASLLLATFSAIGCPATPTPPSTPATSPGPSTTSPSPSATSPSPSAPFTSETPAASDARGTLEVTVRDERGRPVEGAVVFVAGEKPLTPVPTETVRLDQQGLEYHPDFIVARKGQTLEVRNLDAELHNVHSQSLCCSWNVSVVAGGKDTRVLDQAGESTFLCDIHAHMRCVVLVLDADFARTDASGRARIEAPLGVHKLQVQALDRPRWRQEVNVGTATTPVAVALEAAPPVPDIRAPERLPWTVLALRIAGALQEAESWAERGDAASAREAADLALGRWYSGSGLYQAVRDLDASEVALGHADAKGRADDFKSALRKRCARAESVASADPAARTDLLKALRAEDEKLAHDVAEVARALPRRDKPKGDHP